MALANPERAAATLAPMMNALSRTALPLVWLLTTSTEAVVRRLGLQKARTAAVTEEEVRSLIADGTRAGIFVPQEREMIEGVMRLADRSVDVIMTPRSDIVWLGLEDSIDKIAATVAETRHSRVLICRDTIDEPVGVVHARELLAPALRRQSIDLEALMVPVLVVPDGTPVLRVLDLFKRRRLHMAVVVDEFGMNQGIVTPVDVLESIAGELPEAGEELEFTIVRRPDGSWLVDGRVPVDEFRPLFAAQLEETSALVETDKRRFGQGMLACLALDLLARRTAAHRKMANGEGQQAELVVVGAVAVWRAGTAIPGATEIVDRLLQAGLGSRPPEALSKLRPLGRNIVDCPVVPNPGGGVRVLAKEDKTPRVLRRIGPPQRHRQILAIARKAARDALRIGEGW
jgi:Mg2+/Co2+ transporter CorC